jgi:hypothetical protein
MRFPKIIFFIYSIKQNGWRPDAARCLWRSRRLPYRQSTDHFFQGLEFRLS